MSNSSKKTKRCIRFKIKLRKSSHVHVLIFKNEEWMKRFGREVKHSLAPYFQKRLSRRCYARTFQWHSMKLPATVTFCIPFLGAGTVSHEMTHVAVHWLRLTKRSLPQNRAGAKTDRREERLAELVGFLVTQFWIKYYARKRRHAK